MDDGAQHRGGERRDELERDALERDELERDAPPNPAALTARAVAAAGERVKWVGVAATAVLALGASVLAELGVGRLAGIWLVVLSPVGMALALRAGVTGPARRAVQGRKRRLAAVWVPRVPLILSLWGWTTAMVPWLCVVVLPLTAYLLTRLVVAWSLVVLDREARGVEEGRLEDRALAGALGFMALVFGLTVGMGIFVGWSVWYALQGLAPEV